MYRKAELYEFAKRMNDAVSLYRNIVKESPNSEWGEQSKAKLKSLIKKENAETTQN